MFLPCQNHIWPWFTFRWARALKISRLWQYGLRNMFMGVSNFWDHPSQVWTKLVQCLAYNCLYAISYTICWSVCFLTYLLKFYSGGAVDLWSCLVWTWPQVQYSLNMVSVWSYKLGTPWTCLKRKFIDLSSLTTVENSHYNCPVWFLSIRFSVRLSGIWISVLPNTVIQILLSNPTKLTQLNPPNPTCIPNPTYRT